MDEDFEISPIAIEHIGGFWRALDSVARERKYLLFVEAPPIENVRQFVESNIRDGIPQFVALVGGEIVGWCDICPHEIEGVRHFGKLGMGIIDGHREKGIGKRLLAATLAAAEAKGITRVEAEVFASNTRAAHLYRSQGFVEEGVKRRARFIDGAWDDFIVLAHLSTTGA